MPGKDSRRDNFILSLLIISGSEKFDAMVRRSLAGRRVSSVDFRKSAAAGRRCLLERDYDIVLINCPLPDEFGHELALELSERDNTSVLIVVPQEVYESVLDHVTDHGILALAGSFPPNRLDRAIRFLAAEQQKVHRLAAKVLSAQEKTEEIRAVSKAKLMLMEQRRMTEDEAHRYIGRMAMNSGVSRRRIAESIIDELEK